MTHSAADTAADELSFPRLYARTGRFTLGEPRNITVTADGMTVLFVRTRSGVERTGMLWAFDVESGAERLLADPEVLLDGGEHLSDAERARRERSRESGAGIVGYSVDEAGRTAVFALSGSLWACEIATGACRELPCASPVIDPRIDPTGRFVGYASDRALRVTAVDGSGDRQLVGPTSDEEEVTWGQAEFIAAEEMDRYRGFWWSPDGESLLVERYDESPVGIWYIADPAHPDRAPAPHRYPAAGTANAEVSLWHVGLSGFCREVPVHLAGDEYLGRVGWTAAGAVVQTLSRDQRRSRILRPGLHGAERYQADPTLNPVCEVLAEITDPSWVDLAAGLPTLTPDGRMLAEDVGYTWRAGAQLAADRERAAAADVTHAGVSNDTGAPPAGSRPRDATDTHRLVLDGAPITPPGMQLRAVLHVAADHVIATVCTEPTEQQLVRVGYDGSIHVLSAGPGVHTGAAGGDTLVIASSSLDTIGATVSVYRGAASLLPSADGASALREVGRVSSVVMPTSIIPRVTLLTVGERGLRAALVMPRTHRPGERQLPVIMAPYGGPHAQLVRAAGRMFLQAQWLADQGFAVVVADGRGSPGRGPAWERTIRNDFAGVTLADQVDALHGVAAAYPDDLDLGRVGIMGWSYGGYLSALAVLDRPEVFHAAVAGAPVTDWELYDTCYTERYLGDPTTQPEVYARNSLIDRAPQLTRPLLIVHGLADDNVVVAHTLRLSEALLAAGKEHRVLPLTGITHMASDEVVAENLLTAQIAFLKRSLGA